jgi:hypothetical protein
MNFTGRFLSVSKDWQTGHYHITFSINEESALAEIEKIQKAEKLSVVAKIWRKHRSLDANALLWHCIGQIAADQGADKWDIYVLMLKRYGKYTYVCVKPNVVEAVKAQWRECEEVGKVNINGQEAVQMLCYFGSSTYDSKEFSVLLDGVISEMKELGLQPPPTGDIKRAMENYGQHN